MVLIAEMYQNGRFNQIIVYPKDCAYCIADYRHKHDFHQFYDRIEIKMKDLTWLILNHKPEYKIFKFKDINSKEKLIFRVLDFINFEDCCYNFLFLKVHHFVSTK